LADAAETRHAFQEKILDQTAAALKELENDAHSAMQEAKATAEANAAEAAVARSEFESAQSLANAKKEESATQSQACQAVTQEVEVAKQELKAAQENKEGFLKNKEALIADQDGWKKALEEMWAPLLEGNFPGALYRRRNKLCDEFFKTIASKSIPLDASLVEALTVALKLKVDQRSDFAQKAFSCAEEQFQKHANLLTERVDGTATEEAEHDKAIADSEAKLAEVQSRRTEQNNVDCDLQNVWAELETKAGEAKKAVETCDAEVEAAFDEVKSFESQLESVLATSASFTSLRERPVSEAPEASPLKASIEASPESPAMAPEALLAKEMEVEPVAVAA